MHNLILSPIPITELDLLIKKAVKTAFDENRQNALPTTEADQLLTIQQAAELLNLSVPTLYGYVHRAEIPVMKKSKRLYFSKKELFEFVKAGRKKTTAEISAEAENYLSNNKNKRKSA